MRVSVTNLRKTYRDAERELTVIDRLSYEFPEFGSVAIVGKSGVGKSTLLHVLGGLDRATEGDVKFDGATLSGMSDDELSAFRGSRIGFIFQFHHLLHEFSAQENVAMPMLIGGTAESEAGRRASEILGRVGLAERMEHLPGQLSGGEQQRVAIARAVVTRPALILADEPTGNLDFRTAEAVQALLLDINRELKNTLVVVTHNMDLARSMDLVLEMHPGGSLRPLT